MAAEGMDLIVTSGGLGPTADDLTAEVVARFAGRELVLDEEMLEKIAEILRGFAKRFRLDEAAVLEANRKQAMVPEGSMALDPEGTAPGLVVPAGEQVVIVLPGPPRELQPMWAAALEAEPVREVLARSTPLRAYTMRMFGVPESEIAKSLREIEARRGRPRRRSRSPPACAGRDRDRRPLPRRGGGGRRRGSRGPGRAPPARDLQPRRRDDRRAGRGAPAGAQAGAGGVLQRRPAGGADHRPAGRLRLHDRQRRLLLERGQGRAAGRRRGSDRGQGRGLARGRRGDGDRRPGALRRRRRGLDHRHRRARRGQRGEAGRLRLLQRPPRPTAPRSPATR